MDYKISNNLDNRVFITDFSDLEYRIDPSPYHIERQKIIEALEKTGKLFKLKNVVKNAKSITSEITEDDVYIGLENIKSNTGEYITTSDKSSISSAGVFKKGQILFPKLRPYLNKVHLAQFDGLCSTEFHIFDSKSKFTNEFITIYLRSDFIVKQTKHLMTGNTLPRLQTADVENLPIPDVSKEIQEKIVTLYNKAELLKQQKEKQAKVLLDSIDDYLLDRLEIQIPVKNNDIKNRIFTTFLSNVSGSRLDPFFNDTHYLKIEEKIINGKFRFKKLKELCYPVSGVIYSGKDQRTEGKKIIRANNITLETNELNFDSIRFIREDLNISDNLLLKKDDILMSSASGSKEHVGKVCYISEDMDYYFGGFMNVLRKKATTLSHKYLFEFLQSSIFRAYLFKNLGGTNINNLGFNSISHLKVPYPDFDTQKEIVEHIKILRDNAKSLKDDANLEMKNAQKEIQQIILGS